MPILKLKIDILTSATIYQEYIVPRVLEVIDRYLLRVNPSPKNKFFILFNRHIAPITFFGKDTSTQIDI